MPAERAGYTVTMFLIDVSSSMGTMRTVDTLNSNGEEQSTEMTNLEWVLRFVKLKIQEMIFNGRKTDQCGVIVFGAEDTKNVINTSHGGYENVVEYIPIGQPNASTIAKLDSLQPSTTSGDPIDALIVGIETQAKYLANKKTWTRKIVIVTDGESPIEVEDWEETVRKMDGLNITLTIVFVHLPLAIWGLAYFANVHSGVDFDSELDDFPFTESNKTTIKRANEEFYSTLTSSMKSGLIGTCAFALQDISNPELKQVRSTLMATDLRVGDIDTRADEALVISVKTSKCTALGRPHSWKKFGLRESVATNAMDEGDDAEEEQKVAFAQLKLKTEYFVDRNPKDEEDEDGDIKMKKENDDVDLLDEGEDGEENEVKTDHLEKVEKEDLIRGFKYGTTYAPCPDGQFPRLPTRKGIDIGGFFLAKNFRRELALGEVQYIWADPSSPQQQVALSSISQAMKDKKVMAIARWVSKDGMDPKMGVLAPSEFEKVDCLLWTHMPFADDVRRYTFASLEKLISKKGEIITEHPYLPTGEQLEAMEQFIDAMDLMDAGEKDEEGNRLPWFDTVDSYNPAIHRTKQAMFHCAVVTDVASNPLPPPHPELLKYFEPPKRVLKRARGAIEECKSAFSVKEVPKRVAKAKKDGHAHAQDEDDSMLLLDRKKAPERTQSQMHITEDTSTSAKEKAVSNAEDSATEDEDEEELLLEKKPSTPAPQRKGGAPLPTPARSLSPQVDPGRAPGRIIGNTYPLKDFKKNIAQGDVVTKAVEDLGSVIAEVVMRPFASRRKQEMINCMTTLRQTALEEDEIDAWNTFLRDLKGKCLSKPGNPSFWAEVQNHGRELGLISTQEAKKQGGKSSVTENEAGEFLS
ncbi:ku80-like protein [Crassisporium funariophilum]|nr:ku80-like protein [Crassisporium funariophilum]